MCEQWRRADAQLNSSTSKAEVSKHCTACERYVEAGQLRARR